MQHIFIAGNQPDVYVLFGKRPGDGSQNVVRFETFLFKNFYAVSSDDFLNVHHIVRYGRRHGRPIEFVLPVKLMTVILSLKIECHHHVFRLVIIDELNEHFCEA